MNTKNKGFTLVELMVIVAIVVIGLGTLTGGCSCQCGSTTGSGDRTGVIVKCSDKGTFGMWVTHECTANLGGAIQGGAGVVGNSWDFSVEKDTQGMVQDKLKYALETGTPVVMKYHQVMLSWPWEGKTLYRLTGIEPVVKQ